MSMETEKKPKRKGKRIRRILIIAASVLAVMAAAFWIYVSDYYHADEQAAAALASDDQVRVSRTDYGWFFDGPSEENAMIFYPGGKVEETAYAPLLKEISRDGMDVCLVKMPFRLAVFRINAAERVLGEYEYRNWYIGGHSLGGAMAAEYLSSHAETFSGIFLFAAYPASKIPEKVRETVIVGTEDGVINRKKLEESRKYASDICEYHSIEGGNHAWFGSYGTQKGDGAASISHEEQWRETAGIIRKAISAQNRP